MCSHIISVSTNIKQEFPFFILGLISATFLAISAVAEYKFGIILESLNATNSFIMNGILSWKKMLLLVSFPSMWITSGCLAQTIGTSKEIRFLEKIGDILNEFSPPLATKVITLFSVTFCFCLGLFLGLQFFYCLNLLNSNPEAVALLKSLQGSLVQIVVILPFFILALVFFKDKFVEKNVQLRTQTKLTNRPF